MTQWRLACLDMAGTTIRDDRWWSEVDLVLSPADAGRGRPFPDLVLVAARRLGVEDLLKVE